MSDKITETPYHLYPKHFHSVSHKTVFSLTPAAKTPVLFLKTERKKEKKEMRAFPYRFSLSIRRSIAQPHLLPGYQ